MTHRTSVAIAALLIAGPLAAVSNGAAEAAQDTPGCVALGEINHIRAGSTRHEIETRWDARGHWDGRKSTPTVDAYDYRTCNKHIGLRIAYARQTRVWVWMQTAR